jgi:PPK2 family polyphosphate:nucleotide phosphotransferase
MKSIDHARLLVETGTQVDLADLHTGSTSGFGTKDDAKATLLSDIERLSALQDVFYANGQYALLIVFQGMDAAGKDGAIKHVMSGVNPQGVDVFSFKTPTAEELAHDYLWRASKVLPQRGRIGIFNRSYYEELAVVRIHPALLKGEHAPPAAGTHVWKERFEDITAFERHLSRNGTLILKFFLHISNEEQRKRLLARIDRPEKNWKISVSDVRERAFWDAYQRAYSELLTHTSTEFAPWYVIPSDHKWFTRAAVASIIVARLKALDLAYPHVSDERRAELLAERKRLVRARHGDGAAPAESGPST